MATSLVCKPSMTSRSPDIYLSPLFFFLFLELSAFQMLFRRTPVRYYLAACLAMHVASTRPRIPLGELNPDRVQPGPRPYGLLGGERRAPLLALPAHYSGSIILWLPGIFTYHGRGGMGWQLSLQDAQVLIGGVCATMNITLL